MNEDELSKLLAEIDAATPGAQVSASAAKSVPAPVDDSQGGRLAFATLSAAALGGAGAVFGLFLPIIGTVSTGIGAAAGAFVVGLIAGPPRWFSR
ncbi:MAG: hypothetical protein WBJ33_01760 [Candidatus Nanopelagicales bacterium]|jgi:hypothetical protein